MPDSIYCIENRIFPQLLELSGIGPQDELQKFNIPVVVNSTEVGRNLADHPLLSLYYVNSTNTFDDVLRNSTLEGQWLEQWDANRTGLMVNPVVGNSGAFVKSPPELFNGFDPSTGRGSGNTQLIFYNGYASLGPLPQPATGNFLSVVIAVVPPTSRKHLRRNLPL
ncbi:hypothetical protein L218DRAFT_874403 [Marasmius fiardii PR-910]|nr:hypothetical protein L218DRAFT_874403 [Marasmius fiardii PR-910]